jgi:hypothetical protein
MTASDAARLLQANKPAALLAALVPRSGSQAWRYVPVHGEGKDL